MADNRFEGEPSGISLRHEFESIGGKLSGEIELRIDKVQAVMDAKLDGVRHETDGKIERVLRNIWTSAVATGLGVVGLLVAIGALAGDRFEGGASIASLVEEGRTEQAERDRLQDERFERLLRAIEEQDGQSSRSD